MYVAELLVLAKADAGGRVKLEQWLALFENRLAPHAGTPAADDLLCRLEAATKSAISEGVAKHGPPNELLPWEQLHYNCCAGGLSGRVPPPHQYREVVRTAPDYRQHVHENRWQPGRYFPAALASRTAGTRENQALFLQQ